MKTITFNCQFITPAFIGGADTEFGIPELRPPSIKGALRFWWRAMNAHLVDISDKKIPDYTNLLGNDELLFGGVSQVTQKSPVTIRVVEKDMKYIQGRNVFIGGQFEGMEYLFYSLKHHKADNWGFNVQSNFDIIFSAKEKNEIELSKAIASFWLLINFGSVGTRARRCAGSISVNSIVDNFGLLNKNTSFLPSEKENAIDFFKTNFEKIKHLISEQKSIKTKKYSIINKNSPLYLSNASFATWQETVNDIGREMRTLRKGRTSRIEAERTFTMKTLNKKAAFGIPVGVFSDNAVTLEKHDRRSSPVYLSVFFNNNTKKYHWTVLHFEGDFMPDDDKIIFNSKNRNARKKDHEWDHEDNSLIDQFMNKIKSKSQKV